MDPSNAQPAQRPTDQLTAYMQQYGDRLQSAIAGGNTMGDPQVPSGQDLGPDLYQSNIRFTQDQPPPQSAMGQQPQQAPAAGQPPAGGAPAGQADPNAGQSALEEDQGKQTSFKDIWDQQSHEQRQQFIDKLQTHLDATKETINSAYDKMMQQLGQRPQTDLSKQDKGMLLMEFGLRMLSHSAGQSTGSAIGDAGTETLNSYKQQRGARIASQQQYDKMQQQLTQAHDRDVVNLQSRSALEEGRDMRAAQASDASITRVGMQQSGQDARQGSKNTAAADRTNARDASALQRTSITEAGKNSRAQLSASQLKGSIVGDDGYMYGLDKNGKMTKLTDQDGNPVKPAPGQSGVGGGKKSAQQQAFETYMSVMGQDSNGQPLQGAELQKARAAALNYSSNPKATAQMGDSQMRAIAEKSADSFVRANPTSWLGQSTDDIAKARATYAEQQYQRLKRGQLPLAAPPAAQQPESALDSGPPAAGAPPPPAQPSRALPQSALGGGPSPGAAPPARPGAARGVPTQPQPNMPAPNAGQLKLLQQNPAVNARFFLQKFGYLPAGYQRYINATAQPQSALGR